MFKALKRWWKYLTAKTNRSLENRADPAIQLEQAIAEAQDQHRRLKEQAANVIAQQKQAEMRLNRSMEEYEHLQANTRQALIMADEAQRAGDDQKFTEYTNAAESFANRLIALEGEIEQSKSLVLQATQAAEQAKAAVSTNAQALQKKLAERQRLVGQLEQTKMAEQMNAAMAQLNEAVGDEVPTFNEIRDKIEARYAKAQSMSELTGQSVESNMLEIEQAARNVEANARLAEIRSQLGLAPAAGTEKATDAVEAASTGELGTAATEVAGGSASGAAQPAAKPAAQPAAKPEPSA